MSYAAKTTCPSCGRTICSPDEISDYDWNSGSSFDGIVYEDCPKCGAFLRFSAEGGITRVEAEVVE